MGSRFAELCVDCVDPERLARFWSEALGYEITEREGDVVYIEGLESACPGITFIRVPGHKAVKNRLHIDLAPRDREQDEEVERLISLGAQRIDIGQGDDVSWVVLADPEGNEFCVLQSKRP